jgi:hypothetical protein
MKTRKSLRSAKKQFETALIDDPVHGPFLPTLHEGVKRGARRKDACIPGSFLFERCEGN